MLIWIEYIPLRSVWLLWLTVERNFGSLTFIAYIMLIDIVIGGTAYLQKMIDWLVLGSELLLYTISLFIF